MCEVIDWTVQIIAGGFERHPVTTAIILAVIIVMFVLAADAIDRIQ